MTVELTALTLIALLAASLWIPYIVLSSRVEDAQFQSFDRMAAVGQMSDKTQRAYRAHLNLLEQAAPLAMVVIVAHLAGVSNMVTVIAALLFVLFRVLHAVGYIAGWARMPARPLLFTGGWVCILAIGAAALWPQTSML